MGTTKRDTTSITERVNTSSPLDVIAFGLLPFLTKSSGVQYRTTITTDDGREYVGMGYTPEEAEKKASEERDRDE